MMKNVLKKLVAGERIEAFEIEDVMHLVMEGGADPVPLAGLLMGLACRPPEAALLAACARVLRRHRVAVHPRVRPVIDTCGTGGDGANTFNISTAAAMVVAAAGGAVAKHGNRAVSSTVGSADVVEAAGCSLDVGPAQAQELMDATGFAFLFAPAYHPAMAHVASVRRGLGVRTIFNLIGPLANPALAEFQLLGVHHPSLTRVMADALVELECQAALVVHCAGLDELGIHAITEGHRVVGGRVEPFRLDPADIGITRSDIASLRGGADATENADILRRVLAGEPGPRADVVALNAGAALFVAGLADSIADGVSNANEHLTDGSAARVLERYAASSERAAAMGRPV